MGESLILDKDIIGAAGVTGSTVSSQGTGAGSRPSAALQIPTYGPKDLLVGSLPARVARRLCEEKHYLKSYPAGSLVNVGIFANHTLVGVAVIGVGPFNIHRLFLDANPEEVLCLSRLWLDDRCGRNSESRVLGIICRSLRRWQTSIKAIIAYSDPTAGHDGTIYRAAGFAYLGTSEAMPLYRLPDGRVHHSRSLGHSFGTHSLAHFKARGIEVRPVPQAPKFIYVALIDSTWRDRLTRPVLPYSEVEAGNASS